MANITRKIVSFLRRVFIENINRKIVSFLRIALTIFLLTSSFFITVRSLDFLNAIPQKIFFYKSQRVSEEYFTENVNSDKLTVLSSSNDILGNNALEILSILAIFGGIMAYIFKIIVKKAIEDENRHFTEAQMLKIGGLSDYHKFLIYKDACPNKKSAEKIIEIIKKAGKDTEDALLVANRLSGDCNRNELLICVLKNNIVWFYAEKLEYIKSKISEVKKLKVSNVEDIEKNRKLIYELTSFKNECGKEKEYIISTMRYVLERTKNHPKHADNWEKTHIKVEKAMERSI